MTTRIHIGGLGSNVTEDDLKRTFSSLGSVDSIEIIRTKGRSFAYIDFVPNSDKALAKLFSSYNGCMWKGRKLRLEKAKEDYLSRLRREWAEDAEAASSFPDHNVDVANNMTSQEMPKKISISDKMQLEIYFPKLQKIKSLPMKGTGKHKYSFQRIQVPALPLHFCDCEEHSGHLDIPKVTNEESHSNHEKENGGVNEEELDIMRSVMTKLFEKNSSKTEEARLVQDAYRSVKSSETVQDDEDQTAQMSDEDGLIINMVAGTNDKIFSFQGWEHNSKITNQDLNFDEPQTSNDREKQKKHGHGEKKIMSSTKKRKASFIDGVEKDFPSAADKKRVHSETNTNNLETVATHESSEKTESAPQKSSSNLVLSKKFAWKNLVGEGGNATFKIADVTSNGPEIDSQSVFKCDNVLPGTPEENQTELPSETTELENVLEAPRNEPTAVADKSRKGPTWMQRCSWTQLVGDASSSSFSISQILPSSTSGKKYIPQFNGTSEQQRFETSVPNNSLSNALKSEEANGNFLNGSGNPSVDVPAEKILRHASPDGNILKSDCAAETKKIDDGGSIQTANSNHQSASRRTLNRNSNAGEPVPFMRSATSLKEWAKAKAALRGSSKKKE